jgi:hypothetical protein
VALAVLITHFFGALSPLYADLSTGLVAYYPFNGNANDASGNGHDGVVYGATLDTDRFGQPGSCYRFTGTSHWIRANVGPSYFSSNFTFAVWVNFSDSGDYNNGYPMIVSGDTWYIHCHGLSPQYGSSLYQKVGFYQQPEPSDTSDRIGSMYSSNIFETNQWYHLAVTRQGLSFSMFVNGVLSAQTVSTNQVQLFGSYLQFGNDLQNPYSNFHGNLDDIRIYNRALSASEVVQLYNTENGSSGPWITTQPTGQSAQAGANVALNVAASGTPILSYQWRFNGQNIAGATSAALPLTSLTAANSGGYSVVVWNAYGSVTSATASLAVLTDGANGSQPTQIPVPILTPPPTGVDSLVVITHGWEPPNSDTAWVNTLADAIRQNIADQGFSNWYVDPQFWTSVLWPLATGSFDGNAYAQQRLKQQHWAHVHLIGHSAGAAFIESAAAAIKAGSPNTTVHCTFLDPYVGLALEWQDIYGSHADWADCYFTHENLASDPVEGSIAAFTDGMLPHVYNVDVGWLNLVDKVAIPCPSSTSQSTPPVLDQICSYQAFSTHGYAHDFYLASVTGATPACSGNYGFPLSKEAGGWGLRTGYPVGNNTPGVPQAVPCGQSPVVQNPIPVSTGLTFSLLNLPSATSSSGVLFLGNNGASLTSDDPAWLAVGLTITNAANFVQFDAAFTDTNAAEGLLTVYWNTNQIGMVDERAALSVLQTYRFALPATVTNGLYTLGFRLDAFRNITSSITVTNVATGFAGITQPISLAMLLMGSNNTPVLKLTAAPGYNYLVQSSTNLVDWLPTALLVNTNGAVLYADPAVTNSTARFYRAVMP